MNSKLIVAVAGGIVLCVPVIPRGEMTTITAADTEDVFQTARRLGRGINLGNMLEAPNEGDWGVRFDDSFPSLIRDVGFDHVRIPIRWSAHLVDPQATSIRPAFLRRVREVVDQCLAHDLRVVLNVHHFNEIHEDPAGQTKTLQNIWTCIAREFFGYPNQLYFELLNEPHGKLTTQQWNQMFPQILQQIRQRHPTRCVIVGPGEWNSHRELPQLRLPVEDRLLIATCHYYHPFEFTHQGAEWLEASPPPVGRRFPASRQEPAYIAEDFENIARWSRRHQRPVYIGEFGSYSKAPMHDRVRWTELISRQAQKHSFSWAYWEFCSGFGVYDRKNRSWKHELLQKLMLNSN
ncbi:MAG: glycoside hydrolase family 5 protein [Fuerstiella sp.]|nr:glycoside hydrolase family 5 protein [Fuerstiella sp.]